MMQGSTVTYKMVSLRTYGYPEMASSCGVRDGLERMSSMASSSACLVACFFFFLRMRVRCLDGMVDVRFVVRWSYCGLSL